MKKNMVKLTSIFNDVVWINKEAITHVCPSIDYQRMNVSKIYLISGKCISVYGSVDNVIQEIFGT